MFVGNCLLLFCFPNGGLSILMPKITQTTEITNRVDIWLDQCERRSCKIFVICVNFQKTSQKFSQCTQKLRSQFLFTSHLMHDIYLANLLHNMCDDQFTLHILCKLYTHCVDFNIDFGISKFSHCFVANLPLIQFTRFCVKFGPKKLWSGKSFDKYHD